jgi:hypothetical protein
VGFATDADAKSPRSRHPRLSTSTPTGYPPALRIGRVGGAMLRLYLFFSHEERLRDEAPGGVGAGQAPAMRVRKARDCSSQMFSPGAAASDVFAEQSFFGGVGVVGFSSCVCDQISMSALDR